MARLLVALLSLGTQRSGLELALALQLGVVEAACVAQGAGAVGSTSPFGRVDSIAAVAAARGGSTLWLLACGTWTGRDDETYTAALLDLVNGVVRLHAVIVHVDVVALLVALGLGTLAGTLSVLDNLADLLERTLDVVDIGKHLVDLALAGEALGGRLGTLLLLGDTAVGLGKVEDGAGVGANLCLLAAVALADASMDGTYAAERLVVGPVLVVSRLGIVAAAGVGRGVAVGLRTRGVVVLVARRDGVAGQRHLARRHVAGLVGMRSGSGGLRVAARDGAVVMVTVVRLAGRRRSAVGDGRQTGAAGAEGSRRVGKGGNGVLSRGKRGRVQRLGRVRVLVRVGVLARRRSKGRGQAAGRGLRRQAAVRRRRRVLAGAGARDDFGDGGQRLAGRGLVGVVVGSPTGLCGGDHAGRGRRGRGARLVGGGGERRRRLIVRAGCEYRGSCHGQARRRRQLCEVWSREMLVLEGKQSTRWSLLVMVLYVVREVVVVEEEYYPASMWQADGMYMATRLKMGKGSRSTDDDVWGRLVNMCYARRAS